ncbi:MAG TPA: hypothetical protein VLZ74_13975 [Methylocella sp.]|nr:hypothetical protein [Methylocella sp.]
MAATKVDARKIAKAAAEGVAIALAAREEPPIHGPFHIICGIPPEVFEITLESEQAGGFKVGAIKPQAAR